MKKIHFIMNLFFIAGLLFLGFAFIIDSLILFWGLQFLISLFILIKSADYFTDNAEKLGLILGMPEFVVGVTILALGTSLPELLTSLIAVLRNTSEFVAGNVIGSNITNLLLIIGIASLFAKKSLQVHWHLIQIDLPLLLGSAFILLVTLYDGKFTFTEAIISIVAYLVYLMYSISIRKKKSGKKSYQKFSMKIPVILILSAIGLYLSAEYCIRSVTELSVLLNFKDTSIIALTAVALGTSLPELVVSISAAKKNNYGMAVGNVLGSNIFNGFVVTGISGLFGVLTVSRSVLYIGLPVLILATFLFIISIQDREISKYEGLMFLLLYTLFIGKLFNVI